jgi:hypothetical protein
MDYVRDYYSMPWLKAGLRVCAGGKPGVVTSATHYVFVRLDGMNHARPYHPDDVLPLERPPMRDEMKTCVNAVGVKS